MSGVLSPPPLALGLPGAEEAPLPLPLPRALPRMKLSGLLSGPLSVITMVSIGEKISLFEV